MYGLHADDDQKGMEGVGWNPEGSNDPNLSKQKTMGERMNPQQMQMEVVSLRQNNFKLQGAVNDLLQKLENQRAEHAKENVIEQIMMHALSGYASQPRAAHDAYWQKDDTTGALVPYQGGPKWVAQQAVATMHHAVALLEKMAEQANERAAQDQPGQTADPSGVSEGLKSGEVEPEASQAVSG